jgi:hypothetical protein
MEIRLGDQKRGHGNRKHQVEREKWVSECWGQGEDKVESFMAILFIPIAQPLVGFDVV